ncbi:MAG: AraC family transcriptional regulator [Gemmatimonadota bacterium]
MKITSYQTDIAGCELTHQRYSPGHVAPWHRHQTAELCFVSRGSLTEVARGRTLRYPRFGLGFKPADLVHRVEADRRGARVLVVSLPAARLPDFELEQRWFCEPRVFETPDLAHLCVRVAEETAQPDRYTGLVLQGLLLELLSGIARLPSPSLPAKPPVWLSKVEERLREEWSKRPTLRDLASEAGVAPAVLAGVFRRVHGCTVGEFLRRLQVERARVLVDNVRLSLAQVATSCGFYDQSHFTKLFLRYVGTTPDRYRRERTGR